jgi:hypothetical protein
LFCSHIPLTLAPPNTENPLHSDRSLFVHLTAIDVVPVTMPFHHAHNYTTTLVSRLR